MVTKALRKSASRKWAKKNKSCTYLPILPKNIFILKKKCFHHYTEKHEILDIVFVGVTVIGLFKKKNILWNLLMEF